MTRIQRFPTRWRDKKLYYDLCCWKLTESLCDGHRLQDGDDGDDDEGAAKVAGHVTEGDVLHWQRVVCNAVPWDREGRQTGLRDSSLYVSGQGECTVVPGK